MNVMLQLWLLLPQVLLSSAQSLAISGPSYATTLFAELAAVFELAHPLKLIYAPIAEQNVESQLTLGTPVMVDTLNGVPSTSLVIPMFGFPLVIVYNLDSPRLFLTQQVLVDIFLGRITRWNDGNLTLLNPHITLPDQPITVVLGGGSLLGRFIEGLSVLADEPLNIASLSSNNTRNAGDTVCSTVMETRFSIGFSWMSDALRTRSRFALLQNKEGYYASPVTGTAGAMSEYHDLQTISSNQTVWPHNMPGCLSWPLIGSLYLVIPWNVSCNQQNILQVFVPLVMSRSDAIDYLVLSQGWEPAKALWSLGHTLGTMNEKVDYKTLLYLLPCSKSVHDDIHTVGTSTPLWPFLAKLLASYTEYMETEKADPGLRAPRSTFDIQYYLEQMSNGDHTPVDVDIAITWAPVVDTYDLIAAPVFMGSLVPFVNIGSDSSSLALSFPVLADIFSGVITHWNNTDIHALNPEMSLPFERIIVFASPIGNVDGSTALFAKILSNSSLLTKPFSWDQVDTTVSSEDDIVSLVEYTPFSIGYGFGHLVQAARPYVPLLLGPDDDLITFSRAALEPCWLGSDDCWPMALPLVIVLRPPDEDGECEHEKISVDFLKWISENANDLNPYLFPNLDLRGALRNVEFCEGRSLLNTDPELTTLTQGVKVAAQVLTSLCLVFAVGQSIALAIARRRSELKSASVVFSVLAVAGCFLMLLTPLLLAQDNLTSAKCGSAVWFLALGFSLCYGSLFAKLFRLYTIFTSRKLVVPRLSNRKLFWIVLTFLIIDLILLIVYTSLTTPEPAIFWVFIPSPIDLATGDRLLTISKCNFHFESPVLYIILASKAVVVLGGAAMAFVIRQVDRRFTATSALGWAFYNMFLTLVVAILIEVVFKPQNDLESDVFVPLFCGVWIIFITLVALTMDSNVLLACRDISKPLRRMLNGKDSKDSKEQSQKGSKGSGGSKESPKPSVSGSVFVINREMFPSHYDGFQVQLLEKILEELNYQRVAVRRALVSQAPAAVSIEMTEMGERTGAERTRGSTKLDTPVRFNSKSKPGAAQAEHLSHDTPATSPISEIRHLEASTPTSEHRSLSKIASDLQSSQVPINPPTSVVTSNPQEIKTSAGAEATH